MGVMTAGGVRTEVPCGGDGGSPPASCVSLSSSTITMNLNCTWVTELRRQTSESAWHGPHNFLNRHDGHAVTALLRVANRRFPGIAFTKMGTNTSFSATQHFLRSSSERLTGVGGVVYPDPAAVRDARDLESRDRVRCNSPCGHQVLAPPRRTDGLARSIRGHHASLVPWKPLGGCRGCMASNVFRAGWYLQPFGRPLAVFSPTRV